MEEENNRLKTIIHVLKDLDKENKEKYREKLTAKDKQLQILRIQVKRQNNKIKDLLMSVKNMNMLSTTAYDILNNYFGETSYHLFKNEQHNTAKLSNARRYSDEVRRFAVTLHYHSPKAYDFYRHVTFSLLSITFLYFSFYLYFVI